MPDPATIRLTSVLSSKRDRSSASQTLPRLGLAVAPDPDTDGLGNVRSLGMWVWFNMSDSKHVCFPLANHFKLSSKQCSSSEEERNEIKKVLYASIIDSLIYVMVCTKPNKAYIVGIISQFLFNPGKEHWSVVKWALKYLKSTSNFNLCFENGKHVQDGHIYANMAGDINFRNSKSEYLMTFVGEAISW